MYVQDYEVDKPTTHKGYDLNKLTAKELFDKFGLEKGTIDFIGHALALYDSDFYLSQPALELVDRCKLYGESLARYGKSPYLYPLYGLGELPQAFARLAAVYGGTYMLNKPIDRVVYNEQGAACGVVSVGEDGKPAFARCKQIVGDPTYFRDRCAAKAKVVRCIAVLSHPITPGNEASSQIILPQNQIGRPNDVYVFCVSGSHCAAPDGKYVALVSSVTTRADLAENLARSANEELKDGLKLLGKVDACFYDWYEVLEPMADGRADATFISKSYDATSHFEQVRHTGWVVVDGCLARGPLVSSASAGFS
mmetsp:Transcript_30671/g.82076  ORF Transcript_30671/g.82076 Transcript_30671/m.82076 type:complete len:309 (-) Transcript_30671:639-1565(-)